MGLSNMNEKNEFNQVVGCLIKNWVPIKELEPTIMRGNYCVLEPLDINKHIKKLFENLSIDNRGESWTYLPYGPFVDDIEFRSWLKAIATGQNPRFYTILKNDNPVGIASYLRINLEHGVIEIGHLHFSKLLRRTPAATEAMYLMMRYIFEDLKIRRCEWQCNSLNEASKNAALRLGYTFEGIFRQSHVFKDRNRDTARFSIIDCEWPGIKSNFLQWLDPNNFDAEGKQIKSLHEIRKCRS